MVELVFGLALEAVVDKLAELVSVSVLDTVVELVSLGFDLVLQELQLPAHQA